MDDLVEYVKWVTEDVSALRDWVRIAEKILSDLKRSGEESVEELLKNLFAQKNHQEELEQKADGLKDIINTKEDEIVQKEAEIGRLT